MKSVGFGLIFCALAASFTIKAIRDYRKQQASSYSEAVLPVEDGMSKGPGISFLSTTADVTYSKDDEGEEWTVSITLPKETLEKMQKSFRAVDQQGVFFITGESGWGDKNADDAHRKHAIQLGTRTTLHQVMDVNGKVKSSGGYNSLSPTGRVRPELLFKGMTGGAK